MGIRVGIDTGGTFTDLVAVDDVSGDWYVAKVPSTPSEPVRALVRALSEAEFDPRAVSLIVVGTTIGLNAVLTRTGARVVYRLEADSAGMVELHKDDSSTDFANTSSVTTAHRERIRGALL